MATFSTKVSQKDPDRQTNITIACNSLNGTIVKAGETFSFCNTLGPAKPEDGYKEADTFDADGNTVQAYGGGKCQVSSTLYNAVLSVPSLTVVERHAHSGPVYYVEEDKDASLGEENIINDWGNATVVTLQAGEEKNITVAVPQSDLLENGLLARVHVRLNANGTQDSTYAVNATLSKPVWETGSELRLGNIAALYYPELFTISGDTVSFDYTDLGGKTYQGVGVSIDNFDKNAHKFFSFEIENTGETEIGFDIRLVNDTEKNDTICKIKLKAGETLRYANWVDYIFTNSPDANELTKIEIIVNSGETIAAGVTQGTFVLENIAFAAEGSVLGGSTGYEVLPA